MGLTDDPYVAYCFDQAVGYFGSVIEGELEKAGHKPSKEENRSREARERVIKKYLGEEALGAKTRQYADPAALFQKS